VRLRTCVAFVLFTVATGTAALAQGPNLQLFFPAGVSSDKMDVRYVLYGRFGGHGVYVVPKPNLAFLDIPLFVDGVPASEIKMLAWAPGCQIDTFDISLSGLDVQQTYACTPQSTVKLSGRIADFVANAAKPTEVRIDYLAYWACKFFGLFDCMVPQIPLGNAKVDEYGGFVIDLPDFSADPTSSHSDSGAELQLVLRDVRTWNLITFLQPQAKDLRSSGGALKLLPAYPESAVFVARK
jgi:hypothetical protein